MLKFFKTRFFLILELALLVLIILALARLSATRGSIQREIDFLTSKTIALEDKNQILEGSLNETNREFYLELEAKRKLNYRGPGETVFVFYKGSPEVKRDMRGRTRDIDDSSALENSIKWWRYFFK